MKEYRIAFFTVDWNYELVETTLHGLKQYTQDHPNVHVFVFDCFGKELNNSRNESEYMIFNLPELSDFDGVLVQGNQIVLQEARDELARRINKLGIPAITIGCAMPGCTLFGIDNRLAQHDIADHVMRVHGARRLAYITGLMDNGCPEGQQRLDGFMDACRENGVQDSDISLFNGTWRTSDGAAVAKQWLASGKPLPDAFVSANDEMALGLIEVLRENGLHVPEDVLVVGFDNVSSAELSNPRLSTVYADFAELDYAAIDALIRKIDGKENRELITFPHQMLLSESCGCVSNAPPAYLRDKYFRQTRYLKNFYILQDRMAEHLFDALDLAQLMNIVEQNHKIFGCERIYVCINDFYFDDYEKKQWHHDSKSFGQNMVLAACHKDGWEPDRRHEYARFPARQLLPDALLEDDHFLVFYPLHYNTYSIGYLVLNDACEAAQLNLHESILNFMEIAIENVRKKCLLRQLNDVLDDLYVHDGLTRVYNRFGYKRFGEALYQRYMKTRNGVQVLFIDMDDMKGINDRWGHDSGDAALTATARVLQEVCMPGDFIMRYGGDEFMVIASGSEPNLDQVIQRALAEDPVIAGLPFRLGLSIGVITATQENSRTLDECLKIADTLMYEMKSKRKAARKQALPETE